MEKIEETKNCFIYKIKVKKKNQINMLLPRLNKKKEKIKISNIRKERRVTTSDAHLKGYKKYCEKQMSTNLMICLK